MNRIARRAMAMMLLVIVLLGGLAFFVGEFLAKSEEWVRFPGSPHVYQEGKIATGKAVDRTGVLLADFREDRQYSENDLLRRSMLHWVGDRAGNIPVPYLTAYQKELLDYSAVGGSYTYGNAGGTVSLTLSAKAQMAALEAMGDLVGTVAVYNYQTGEILCAITTPGFDPERPPDLSQDSQGAYTGVYWNRFLQSRYIPGSVFKIVTLTAALELVEGIEEKTFTCRGRLRLPGGEITCMASHGEQTLKDAFLNSCNCAFAQIALLIGPEEFQGFVEELGVLNALAFDGYTTERGNFRTVGEADSQVGWSGVGQHKDQINPCAFLAFLGALAGEGTGALPYLVSGVQVDAKQTYQAQTQHQTLPVSRETARTVKEYMGNNVLSKYGPENFPGLTVCAKSGTGEVGGGKKPNAVFAGFLDQQELPLAFIAVVEDGGFGASVCVPVLSRVLSACAQAMVGDNGGI